MTPPTIRRPKKTAKPTKKTPTTSPPPQPESLTNPSMNIKTKYQGKKTPTIASTQTPRPSGSQKKTMVSPKKTPDIIHQTQGRDTDARPPAESATPTKDTTKNTEAEEEGVRKFTIGHNKEEKDDKEGIVRTMKMVIERKIRQGRRWEAVEDTRKRIVTPAKAKRTRGEDGEWDSPATGLASQPSMLAQPEVKERGQAPVEDVQVKKQTPMRAFLVHQSLEERAASLKTWKPQQKEQKPCSADEENERSALSILNGASPRLRKRIVTRTGAAEDCKTMEIVRQPPEKKNTIINFIRKTESQGKREFNAVKRDNNDRPCAMPGSQPGTSTGHEMEHHPEESSKPIQAQKPDHVTSRLGLEPIGFKNENEPREARKSSHFE